MDQATNLRNIIKAHEQQVKMGAQQQLPNREEKKERHAKVITVTSGKGGVGKSNISINLGIALQKLGNRVVILDADFGLANVEVMLGIRPRFNLADLLFRGRTVEEVITRGPEGIGFISGGSGIEELINLDPIQIRNLTKRLSDLDELADYIIVDTGAGISDGLMQFIKASDRVLLVVTPEPTSITDAYAVLKSVSRTFADTEEPMRIDLVPNRVGSFQEGRMLHKKLLVVIERFLRVNLHLAGSVIQDMNISKAVMAQMPIVLSYPHSPAAVAINTLAKSIHEGTSVEKQSSKKGIRELFGSFLKGKISL